MELDGKAKALLKVTRDRFEYESKMRKEFGYGYPIGAMIAGGVAHFQYRAELIARTPASMFNKDGTLNKRKLDSNRRKELRNGAIILGLNLKGESK